MFDIGWTEMLVIAIVMIVVVGPKDLPKMLRTFGKMTTKMRSMAGDFQKQFNEALKEAELDDVKKSVDALRSMNPANEIKKQLNPFEKAAADVRAGLQSAMAPKPSTAAEPAAPTAHEAEPLKNGATAMPGVAGPEAMPAPPSIVAPPSATATPAPSPESAKPMAAAAPMPDPQPAKANGTKSQAASKPAPVRAAKPRASTAKPAAAVPETKPKAPARAKSATAAAPAATKTAKAKPAAAARKPAEKSK